MPKTQPGSPMRDSVRAARRTRVGTQRVAFTMPHKTISISIDFPQPLSAVFAHLSEHENLAAVFGVPIKRIATSRDPNEPNGLGSVRRLFIGPVRVEETITAFEKDRTIEYRVTKGGFLKHHHGVMRFSEQSGGTHLDYTVEIQSIFPFVTMPLTAALGFGMRRGLTKLSRRDRLALVK